jgi:hypothetical protein
MHPHFLDIGTSWLSLGKELPVSHWIGGWVDPRAGRDDVKKSRLLILSGFELLPLGRPVPY